MLSKEERNELFEWIVKVNLKFSRGLALDFKDGTYLASIISHYISSSFVQSTIVSSLAPSKCLKNWESLRDTELKALGITVDDVQQYSTGKSDADGRPCVETLLWDVRNAIQNYQPGSTTKVSRWIRPATVKGRGQKPSSYIDEVETPKAESNSETVTPGKVQSKTVAAKTPSTKKPSGFKTVIDKLDGADDGKFFGIELTKKPTVKAPAYSDLQKQVQELTALVQKQDSELREMRKQLGLSSSIEATKATGSSKTLKPTSQKTATTSAVAKPAEVKKAAVQKINPNELVVASMTYIEDQTEELKGKCWINFKLSDGKQFSTSYDEKTTDVQIHKGAHKHTDSIETLEFETGISPLSWFSKSKVGRN